MENIDRRVIRTKKLLEKALLQLILERGYESIRVQDITEAANLGRATFYVHYHDKETLLLATIKSTRNELLEYIEKDSEPGGLPGFRALFNHAQDNPTFYQVILNHVGGRQQITKAMTKTVKTKLPAPPGFGDIPGEFIANYIVGAVLQLLDWWLSTEMQDSIEKMESNLLTMLVQGISIPEQSFNQTKEGNML
jgi:hypothetical protein